MTVEQHLADSLALAQDLSARLERLRTYILQHENRNENLVKIRLDVVLPMLHGITEEHTTKPL